MPCILPSGPLSLLAMGECWIVLLEERRYTWLYMYMLEILQAAIMLSCD